MGCGTSVVGSNIKIIDDDEMNEEYKKYGPKKSENLDDENNENEDENENNENNDNNTNTNEDLISESEKIKKLEEKKKKQRELAEQKTLKKKFKNIMKVKKKEVIYESDEEKDIKKVPTNLKRAKGIKKPDKELFENEEIKSNKKNENENENDEKENNKNEIKENENNNDNNNNKENEQNLEDNIPLKQVLS